MLGMEDQVFGDTPVQELRQRRHCVRSAPMRHVHRAGHRVAVRLEKGVS